MGSAVGNGSSDRTHGALAAATRIEACPLGEKYLTSDSLKSLVSVSRAMASTVSRTTLAGSSMTTPW